MEQRPEARPRHLFLHVEGLQVTQHGVRARSVQCVERVCAVVVCCCCVLQRVGHTTSPSCQVQAAHSHDTMLTPRCRYDGVWHEGTAKCGSYAEVQPALPGAPSALPNIELCCPELVLAEAAAAAATAGANAGAAASAAGAAVAAALWSASRPGSRADPGWEDAAALCPAQ